jgi:hypothetical protein
MFYENYACGSDRNYTGFCDKEVDALIDRQSAEPNAEKRRQLVWEIERRLGGRATGKSPAPNRSPRCCKTAFTGARRNPLPSWPRLLCL